MSNYLTNKLLAKQTIKDMLSFFERESIEIRLVGGCIRNALMGKETKDFDLAVNVRPDQIIKVLEKNKIQYDNFAEQYGSISAFNNNQKFEITSLRKDINQQGRHTEIIYTNNWKIDAERRDFTINAMYLSVNGTLYDYFNGKQDLAENKLKFIGDINESIKQDFLRIFRYYRFLGIFEKPQIIKEYELVLHKYCNQAFKNLSNDLIRNEILKMFNNFFPINSFCSYTNKKEINSWVKITKQHFEDTKYDLGLNKCLNKIDLFFNK